MLCNTNQPYPTNIESFEAFPSGLEHIHAEQMLPQVAWGCLQAARSAVQALGPSSSAQERPPAASPLPNHTALPAKG